jgi:hypothetical protein
MPRLKPKSSAIFLGIKRYKWTKIGEVTYHLRNLLKSGWSQPSIAVKLLTLTPIMVVMPGVIAAYNVSPWNSTQEETRKIVFFLGGGVG